MRGHITTAAIVALLVIGSIAGFDLTYGDTGVGVAEASSTASGVISENTTWTADDSPVSVTGNIRVDADAVLTIEAGVTVLFEGYYQLQINGTLKANGTAEDPITFTSNMSTPEVGDWRGVVFTSECDWLNSTLGYCVMEYADAGVECNGYSPGMDHCKMRNNYDGIRIWGYYDNYPMQYHNKTGGGSDVRIENCTVANNKYTGISVGVEYMQINEVLIKNNIVVGNGGGIQCSGSSCHVIDNYIINNLEQGLSVYSYDERGGDYGTSGGPSGGNATVVGNSINNNGHYGIFTSGNTLILDNDIQEHVFAIYSYGLPEIHQNNIVGYGEHGLYTGYTEGVVNATYNWWGTDNITIIEEAVWDNADNTYSPVVNFTPYLTSAINRTSSIVAVWPDHGGNTGKFTMEIGGTGLPPGATVTLEREGYSDIDAETTTTVHVSKIIAQFNLSGKAAGLYDVMVKLPNGTKLRLDDSFTIDEGGEASPWVDLVGRSRIRAGGQGWYMVRYGNSGNVDAQDLLLLVSIPKTVEYSVHLSSPESSGIDWDDVPPGVVVGNQRIIPLWIPEIPAGESFDLRFTIQTTLAMNGQFLPIKVKLYQQADSEFSSWGDYDQLVTSATFKTLVEAVIDVMLEYSELNGTISDNEAKDVRELVEEVVLDIVEFRWEAMSDGARHGILTLISTVLALAYTSDSVPAEWTTSLENFTLLALAEFLELICADIEDELIELLDSALITAAVVMAVDPNDKAGPSGQGPKKFIPDGKEMAYTIFFENKADATAPAQTVVVTDQLPDELDWESLEFGEMSHPDVGEAAFDPDTGIITWTFTDIFLPPNQNPPEGEGWVTFTIDQKEGLPSGTQIINSASIVFDFNDPIVTPDYVNTIDAEAPRSTISATPGEGTDVTLEWSSDDGAGSGVKHYSIYRSTGEGSIWDEILVTGETATTFTLKPNLEYRFVCIATDKLEQKETLGGAETRCVKVKFTVDPEEPEEVVWDIEDAADLYEPVWEETLYDPIDEGGTGGDGGDGDPDDGAPPPDDDTGDNGGSGDGGTGGGDDGGSGGGDPPDEGGDGGDDGGAGGDGGGDGGDGGDGDGGTETSGGDKETGGDVPYTSLLIAAIFVIALAVLAFMLLQKKGKGPTIPDKKS